MSGNWRPRPGTHLTCTPDDLTDIITEPSGGYYLLPVDPYNEVVPGIYIGDGTTALCTGLLKRLGVTHVLNAAQGKDRKLCLVNTSPAFYRDAGIQFYGVQALDICGFRLDDYFHDAADFIDRALNSGGKVLVHCREGISRSATLVLAFLMIKKHLSAQEATRAVRANREIIPNEGFLRQLCLLNEQLLRDKARNRAIICA